MAALTAGDLKVTYCTAYAVALTWGSKEDLGSLNRSCFRDPLVVDWISDTFDNNFEIDNHVTNYLKVVVGNVSMNISLSIILLTSFQC